MGDTLVEQMEEFKVPKKAVKRKKVEQSEKVLEYWKIILLFIINLLRMTLIWILNLSSLECCLVWRELYLKLDQPSLEGELDEDLRVNCWASEIAGEIV